MGLDHASSREAVAVTGNSFFIMQCTTATNAPFRPVLRLSNVGDVVPRCCPAMLSRDVARGGPVLSTQAGIAFSDHRGQVNSKEKKKLLNNSPGSNRLITLHKVQVRQFSCTEDREFLAPRHASFVIRF
jgi:hypothetical protein